MDRTGIVNGIAGLLQVLVDVVADKSAASAQQREQTATDNRVFGMSGFEPAQSRPRRKPKKPCLPCGDKKGA